MMSGLLIPINMRLRLFSKLYRFDSDKIVSSIALIDVIHCGHNLKEIPKVLIY